MIFSKQFLQNQLIAISASGNTKLSLHYFKGIFFVIRREGENSYITSKEGFENLISRTDEFHVEFTNSFLANDVVNIATLSTINSVFQSDNVGEAINESVVLSGLPTTGYIEPVVISSIDDPLLLPTVTYCKYLQNRLKENNISFKGFEVTQ